LMSQKEKIKSLEKAEVPSVAFEVSGQLYLNDAFRYLQTAQLVKNIDESESNEGSSSDSDDLERKL
ncbi:hypothetical protein C0995_002895, partial [Termitomyces sp. Mi166